MIFAILMLLVGFTMLVLGADHFVASASTLAKKLGVPALIVGLTVVAFGTSAPELTVSVTAGLSKANEIAISNVLGSNIFNLLMVAGGSAIVAPLLADKSLLKRDWPAAALATVALFCMIAFDGMLSRVDGLLLLCGFAAVLTMQIKAALKERASLRDVELETEVEEVELKGAHNPLALAFHIVLSLVAIVVGGQLTVDGATEIARMAGLSETIIGLTIVAIGTSLPELVTSVMATRRGENDIAIGNVIGSNLFNVLLILGTSSAISPIPVKPTAVMDSFVLIIISLALFLPIWKEKFGRKSGVACVMGYAAYTAWIILR